MNGKSIIKAFIGGVAALAIMLALDHQADAGRDGAGVYTVPAGTRAVTGTVISSTKFNAFIDDIEADQNTDRPVAAGGTGASTAAAARANLGVRAIKAIDTTGSSNAYAVTTTDSLTPTDGDMVVVIANFSNTGAATLNVDSTGAVAIDKWESGAATALTSGDMTSGNHYILTYDSGIPAWVVANPDSAAAPGLASLAADTTPQLGGNLDVNTNSIVSTSNGDITLNPNGTGNVVLGNYTLDGDQTVGAGQDNYCLTYDNAGGLISLEACAGAGSLSNVVEDTTPQLGGDLDVNTQGIAFPSVTITDVLDEDAMTSNSATAVPTQQSVKAYVDATSQAVSAETYKDLSSAGSTSTFTGIAAGANRITIVFQSVSTDTTALTEIRLGDSGGIETTNYTSMCGSTTSTTGILTSSAATDIESEAGVYVLTRIQGNAWVGSTTIIDDASGPLSYHCAGFKSTSAELTQVQIATQSGSFDAGVWNIIVE